jgi:hypothetical protein
MKEPLSKDQCNQIQPFVNALQNRVKDQTVTKMDISIFITLVKDILKNDKPEQIR